MGSLKRIRTELTAKKKTLFLQGLKDSAGNVTSACAKAAVSRQTPYDWREADKGFAENWDAILEGATEAAEQELFRRAVKGVLKPIYQSGKLVGRVREYSDTCLIFLLKARRPKVYNPVQRIAPTNPDGTESVPLKITLPANWGKIEAPTDTPEDA